MFPSIANRERPESKRQQHRKEITIIESMGMSRAALDLID